MTYKIDLREINYEYPGIADGMLCGPNETIGIKIFRGGEQLELSAKLP